MLLLPVAPPLLSFPLLLRLAVDVVSRLLPNTLLRTSLALFSSTKPPFPVLGAYAAGR